MFHRTTVENPSPTHENSSDDSGTVGPESSSDDSGTVAPESSSDDSGTVGPESSLGTVLFVVVIVVPVVVIITTVTGVIIVAMVFSWIRKQNGKDLLIQRRE